MGREIRKVPSNWEHPTKQNGDYIPLFGESFTKTLARWEEHKKKWDEGFRESFDKPGKWIPIERKHRGTSYEEWDGEKPLKEHYMPEWPDAEKTHIQLYESTTEGTPESPVFKADEFEQLCEYAAEHCTTFADYTATKEQWMEMLKSDFGVHHTQGNTTFI